MKLPPQSETGRRVPVRSQKPFPHGIFAKLYDSDILHAFARATGLTVVLEDITSTLENSGPPCGRMSHLTRHRIDECVARRAKLLKRVQKTGDSAATGCPVGAFCLAVPVYALGFQIAILRAGGFTKKMGTSKIRADAVLKLLQLTSIELGHRAVSLSASQQSGSQAARRAMYYIHAHSNEPIQNQDVARESGVSRQHLARIWKKQIGVTLHAYLSAIRIDHAKTVLEEKRRKIIDTAFECGFGSVSQFNRAFLRATGVSPRHWLERQR